MRLKFSQNIYVHIGFILILGIACYANSLSVPMQMDDYSVVRFAKDRTAEALNLQGFINNPRWFANLTFHINRHLHGDRVFGYHLVNIFIHLSSACLVYFLIRKLVDILHHGTKPLDVSDRKHFLLSFVPCAVAALFVSHPVQTQAVTYIVQRYTSLSALFYLCSLQTYLKARWKYSEPAYTTSNRLWFIVSFLSATLAMKCKEIALTLPIMIMVLEYCVFQGRLFKNTLFVIIITVLLLFIPSQLLLSNHNDTINNTLASRIQTASAETETISRSEYLLTQTRVVATYLRLLILPVNQNLDYDYRISRTFLDIQVIAALLLHLSLMISALLLYKRSNQHLHNENHETGVCLKLASLGIIWFYLCLTVESSLIPIRDVIFEHRIYLPSIGFFLAVTACAAAATIKHKKTYSSLWFVSTLLCCVLTLATIARNRVWGSEFTIWQDVLNKSPNKARAKHSIGFLYFKEFKPVPALPYLIRAVELEPSMDKYWITLNAEIAQLGKFEGRFSTGTDLHSSHDTVIPERRKQWVAISYNNLGLAYEYSGNIFMSQGAYLKSVAADPTIDFVWYNLALVSMKRNDTATVHKALGHLKQLNPRLEKEALQAIEKLR